MTFYLPQNEHARLEALIRYKILDTDKEDFYNDIVSLTTSIMNVPSASVIFIDADRTWIKATTGNGARQGAPREYAFCSRVVMSNTDPLIVKDATIDERFWDNPYVLNEPNVRFYFGEPLVSPDKEVIGALCGFDTSPRNDISETQLDSLKNLSRLIMSQLEFLIDVHEKISKFDSLGEEDASDKLEWSDEARASYKDLLSRCNDALDKIKARNIKQ